MKGWFCICNMEKMNHCQTTTKQMSIVYGISRNQCLLQKKTLQETNESNISINRQAIFLKTNTKEVM